MKKSFQNEVMKKQFFLYLKEVKGFANNSVDAHERAVLLWQESNDNKAFAGFGKQQVRAFKDWLKNRTNRKGEALSLVYRYHVLRRLRLFFEWLSMQPHYKSKINPTVVEFLSLSKKETRIAIQPNKRKIPPLEDVIKVIESIDVQTEVDQRDRALLCFTLLTGARISAIYSLPMKAFEPDTLTVDQNPKFGVKTKFSKRIVTTFFPIEYEQAIHYFLDWYKYLERKKGFKADDPIFPQSIIENGKENISYYNTGEVEPLFWASSNSVRKIFQKHFLNAEVPYYHPHTFRHLVVKEFAKTRLTEEEKKAISQNLGHENTGTTFGSYGYGHIQEERQIEIVKNIKVGEKEVEGKYGFSKEEMKQALAEAIKESKEGESL
ncbi:site-specific integrase [Candidatus Peregrinibacteria bacterium]|jgi:integrase/recombinase XerD|nr:site-specific integrase [Candidatus Peregrinibacteria bacterium]MBT4632364.1 site-specific integrase [Candidatus Peregrinibacteria bacterium]